MTGAERRARLAATRVYLVVGDSSVAAGRRRAAVESALSSGVVGAVQLREKGLPDAELVARARALGALARAAGALLVLNDRVDLVAEAGADGVHVGEDDPSPREARRALGSDLLVGVSAHDAAEVAAAEEAGADYAGLGPCFPTSTKALSRTPRGPALVADVLPGARIPVFPIGGIDVENAPSLARAGATRVAVGAGILSAPDPRAAALAIAGALAIDCPG
jgi:thiamine-phosphate diphosphorylase